MNRREARQRRRRARVLDLNAAGMTADEIATLLRCGNRTVYRDLAESGAAPVPPGSDASWVDAALEAGVCIRHPQRRATTMDGDIPLCDECDADTRLVGGAVEYATVWRPTTSPMQDVIERR